MFGSLAQNGIKPQRSIERRRPSPPARTAVRLFVRATKSQPGLGVRFITAFYLVHELIEARDEKKLLRLRDLLAKVSLLIVDELGYVPLSQTRPAASSHRRLQPALRRMGGTRIRGYESLGYRVGRPGTLAHAGT